MAAYRESFDDVVPPTTPLRPEEDRRDHSFAAAFASEDARRLAAIYEIGKVLTASIDPGESVRMALNILASFLELRHGAMALLVEPEHSLDGSKVNPYVIAATVASAQPQAPNADIMPHTVVDGVLRTGMPILVQNVRTEMPALADRGWIGQVDKRVSLIAVPVQVNRSDRQALGVLLAYRIWDLDIRVKLDDDLGFLMMVGTLVGHSLRMKKLVAEDRERLIRESNDLRKALDEVATVTASALPADIVGDSPQIHDVVERLRKVAPTRSTVLLRGESGTGKELFARALHAASARADRPFVKVNCAALSETLLESELFGHEKGSFTGANAMKKGRFELADGGTLFLDEIGEISKTFQVKLLRVLQEGEFERVGGTRTLKVDIRLVAATNRNLEEAVATDAFRADLYYRICVVPIMLPPLRDRPGDIPLLARAFLTKFNRENGTALRMAEGALDTLRNCYFPGNVR
ncbi:MAG: sigma 54-interacting transcriptional regulator, partial [Rhodospirillaceae bacterium]|nr:sigma 54-interacting transcriptional regulator [Rhodospirillaceae bacterium]